MSTFANSVLVQTGQGSTLQTIGAFDNPRKKRPHSKSRRGCVACKRRRVKCDERSPCSSCMKRNIQCLQPSHLHIIGTSLSTANAHFKMDTNPTISLLHLELFHHWDTQTRSTLAFAQIWPVVMQRAFHEEFIMSAILCVAALHLVSLRPADRKYAHASMHLTVKTAQLFRRNLSRAFTKHNCEALMGAALLINYISWSDVGFLMDNDDDDDASKSKRGLRLEQDQLFLMSPGIVRVWFAAVPVFIDEGSVFVQLLTRDTRGSLERALVERGENPERFVEPFMNMWDDELSQVRGADETRVDGPTSYAWRFLRGLERNLLPCRGNSAYDGGHNEQNGMVYLKDTVTKLTAQSMSLHESSLHSARESFKYIIRRLSPLLCCIALLESTTQTDPIIDSCATDIEQLVYGFPILCCGPFAELVTRKDSRALVFLFHFYWAVRVLLEERCWWAATRSPLMEKAILKELEARGIDMEAIMIR